MWDKSLYVFKWIGGIIGGVMAIVGVVTIIYTQGIKAEQKRYKESAVENKIDKLIVSDSIQSIKIDEVLSNQTNFTTEQASINSKLDNLNKSYIKHLKTDKKVDELIQYLEDVKKNNSIDGASSWWIAPGLKPY